MGSTTLPVKLHSYVALQGYNSTSITLWQQCHSLLNRKLFQWLCKQNSDQFLDFYNKAPVKINEDWCRVVQNTQQPVAPTLQGTEGGTRATHFYKWYFEQKNSKHETDQTVLTITKALIKMTNCTCKAKKVKGHNKNLSSASCRKYAPTFKFVPVSLPTTVHISKDLPQTTS